MINDMDRVVPMDQMDDFRVAADCPDPRGWDVIGSDGELVGEVEEMLVDTAAMSVRYLDVCLNAKVSGSKRDRHVLVPIGRAELDASSDCVHLHDVSAPQAAQLPEYRHGPVTREFETEVRARFEGGVPVAAAAPSTDAGETPLRRAEDRGEVPADFYAGPLFDDSRFYGRRSTDRGTAPR
jgi:photosynthetic reaction center H subunit